MLIMFIICSFINVVLNTLKSILTVKAGKHTAALINAVTFGFYTIVVKQLTSFPLLVSVPVTMVMNLVGVYASIWLLNKFKKDKIWKITVITSYTEAMLFDLQGKIKYVQTSPNSIDFFSYNQQESQHISALVSMYGGDSYFQEINKFQ